MAEKEVRCRARLSLGDDEGDNSCTFHCQLPRGHGGLHIESFSHYGYKYKDRDTGKMVEEKSKHITVSWWGSEHKFELTRIHEYYVEWYAADFFEAMDNG